VNHEDKSGSAKSDVGRQGIVEIINRGRR